jgi:hypothetical protein
MSEGAVLMGRLPPPSSYEPMLVTTLRRYHRRGSPASLLTRIAGGAMAWRLLNDWWSIDGTVRGRTGGTDEAKSPMLGDQLLTLSGSERRIALVQLADVFGEARRPFPARTALARYFGVTERQIRWDLGVLASRGEIADRLVEGGDAD